MAFDCIEIGDGLYQNEFGELDVQLAEDSGLEIIPGEGLAIAPVGEEWWKELDRDTLEGVGDSLGCSFPVRKYLKIIFNIIPSGQVSPVLRFNGDTGTNYAQSYSSNYGAVGTTPSATSLNVMLSTTTVARATGVIDLVNVDTVTKTGKVSAVHNQGTNSAADVPIAWDSALKWVNVVDYITSISMNNAGTGSYDLGTELIVLGHD